MGKLIGREAFSAHLVRRGFDLIRRAGGGVREEIAARGREDKKQAKEIAHSQKRYGVSSPARGAEGKGCPRK